MNEWISIEERLPETDIMALVCNAKGWMHDVKAIYHKRYDVWQLYNPESRESILLDVTHWIPIPPPPKM